MMIISVLLKNKNLLFHFLSLSKKIDVLRYFLMVLSQRWYCFAVRTIPSIFISSLSLFLFTMSIIISPTLERVLIIMFIILFGWGKSFTLYCILSNLKDKRKTDESVPLPKLFVSNKFLERVNNESSDTNEYDNTYDYIDDCPYWSGSSSRSSRESTRTEIINERLHSRKGGEEDKYWLRVIVGAILLTILIFTINIIWHK